MPLPRQGKGGIDLATYTANYGLHQWEATDDFLRTDFNTDFGIIDGALGEKAEMAHGQYVGTGATGHTIILGFQPKVLVIIPSDTGSAEARNASLILVDAIARYAEGDSNPMISPYYSAGTPMYTVTPTATGMELYSHPNWNEPRYVMNEQGRTYHYVVCR